MGCLWRDAGYDFLGSTSLAAGAVTTGALTFEPRDLLLVQVRIVGVSGAGDNVALRLNGDSTGTNYRTRFVTFSNVATPVAAGVDFSAPGFLMTGPANITLARTALLGINNMATLTKAMWIQLADAVAAQGTIPSLAIGWAQWFNTAAQITSLEMRTNGGTLLLSAGSGFSVFGRNV